MDKFLVTFKLAGALAEEGCSLEQIVVKVTEAVKGIGESPFFSLSLKLGRNTKIFFPVHCFVWMNCRNAGGESVSMQCPRLPAVF